MAPGWRQAVSIPRSKVLRDEPVILPATELHPERAHPDAERAGRSVPMAAEPFAVSADYYQEMEESSRKRVDAWADEAVADLKSALPNAEISKEVVMGAPSRMIIESATNWGADLIVVGSHGRGFWGRVMLGSVSDAILHHAPCSVLVVR